METQYYRTVALSSSLDTVSNSIVRNAFRPVNSTASHVTVGSTSSAANLDPDWTLLLGLLYNLQSGVLFCVESCIKRPLRGEIVTRFQNTYMNAMEAIRISR